MKRLITIACLGVALCAPAFAQSDKASQASALGVNSILASPVLSLEGKPLEASAALGLGGTFVVVGVVEGASEVVSLTLKGVEAGSTFIVKASTKAVKAASVATGASIRVVAESTGYALMASGQLLAFVPNAIGQALLHQSQIK
jgi:hypothetical protein